MSADDMSADDMSAGDISSYAKLIYLPRGTGIDRVNVVNFDNIHFSIFKCAILVIPRISSVAGSEPTREYFIS